MTSIAKEEFAWFDYSETERKGLENKIANIRVHSNSVDPVLYPEVYNFVQAKIEYLSDLIASYNHHNDHRCYFHITDLVYYVKLLPKEERKEYMRTSGRLLQLVT